MSDTHGDGRNLRAVIARVSETPALARAIRELPPAILHGVIRKVGLEDCSELLSLATSEQLSAVFDLDLWRPEQAGSDELFDAARFGHWLEVLADSDVALAAQRLAEMDVDLVIAGLASHIAVFDPVVFGPAVEQGDDEIRAAARERGSHCEVGGYLVVARQTESWDAIVAVLLALDDTHPGRFHRVMRGCRRMSNSRPEADGFHDLLGDVEQARFDLALGREGRRERQGYVTPAQARAFLEESRAPRASTDGASRVHPIFAAYLEAARKSDEPRRNSGDHESPLNRRGHLHVALESRSTSESADRTTLDESASAVATVLDLLADAGALPERPRALLAKPDEAPPFHRARLHAHMQFVHGHDDAFARRTEELAFLANVLMVGCSVQARPLSPLEASDGAAAVCNLGLERLPIALPDDFLVDRDLVSVFQAGWSVLHHEVCMCAAEQLLGALAAVHCSDREIQILLYGLQQTLTRHWRAGAPWRARDGFEVLSTLDMPAWAALLGLIDEFPVMLANVRAAGRAKLLSFNPSTFEFISENADITAVHTFLRSLPELLM